MERRTTVQAACVFVATVAAGLPFALQAGQWMAGWSGDAPAPVPAQTQVVDAGTGAAPGDEAREEPTWDEPPGEGGGIVPAPGERVAVLPTESAAPAAVAPVQGKPAAPGQPEPTVPAEEPSEPQTEPSAEPEPTKPPEDPEDPPASEPPAPALTPLG